MDQNSQLYLEMLYKKIRKSMPDKLENDSVFLTLIRKDSNPVLRVLKESALRNSEIPYLESEDLSNRGFIQEGVVEGTIVLTASGLWDIEKRKGLLSEHNLVEYFQEKKFENKSIDSKLTDSEKVVLFSMVATRAFSEDSCVDLLGDRYENVIKGWESIISSTADFLLGTKIISGPSEKILIIKGNEHPINFLFQHTDKLPKKTRLLYTALGRQRKYFLDISEGGNISISKLSALITQIFENRMDYDNIQITVDFCQRLAYDCSVTVFNSKTHLFADPDCDRIVEEAITKAVLGV